MHIIKDEKTCTILCLFLFIQKSLDILSNGV